MKRGEERSEIDGSGDRPVCVRKVNKCFKIDIVYASGLRIVHNHAISPPEFLLIDMILPCFVLQHNPSLNSPAIPAVRGTSTTLCFSSLLPSDPAALFDLLRPSSPISAMFRRET